MAITAGVIGLSHLLRPGDWAEASRQLHGKTGEKSLRLNLSKARDEKSADALRELAARGKPALFFVVKAPRTDGAAEKSRGLLHIDGRWAVFDRAENGVWVFDDIDNSLQAVGAGGTDMLRRAVDYILQDEDAVVPVTDGVSWSEGPVKVAALDGAMRAVRPISIAGDGKPVLFVACEKGERCFAWDGKEKLMVASRALAR